LRPALQLTAILILQGALLFSHLSLLPVWSDELFTLQVVTKPLGEMVAALAADIHPPLYFLIAWAWPWKSIEGLRVISGLWAIAAAVLLDVLWLRRWKPSRRFLALAIFAFSPCLLLYGRMARSYSMQTALALLAATLLWRSLSDRRMRIPAAAASLGLLYTHYVPGLAVLGAFAVAAWMRKRKAYAAALGAMVAAGYLPWAVTLSAALNKWRAAADFSSNYKLTGSELLEHILKAGYGIVSLAIGETFVPVLIVLVPAMLYFAARGARKTPHALVVLVLVAAALGYIGVARWVSYPFIPARLLWLLPFLILAVIVGAGSHRKWVGTTVLAASAVSIGCYFAGWNYLNHGYQAPLREIAAELNQEARTDDLIVIDAYNTDGLAQIHYLEPDLRAIVLSVRASADVTSQLEKAPRAWFVRNVRDISPGHLRQRVEAQYCDGRPRLDRFYLPYQAWQQWLLRRIVSNPPAYYYSLTLCGADPH
jgi:uncharacterized membrane protein